MSASCLAATAGSIAVVSYEKKQMTIEELIDKIGETESAFKSSNKNLEEYWRSMYRAAIEIKDEKPTLQLFFELITKSINYPPLDFKPEWLNSISPPESNLFDATVKIGKEGVKSEFKEFEFFTKVLEFQIAELRKMKGKQLENEHKYFGIDSETGNRWFNFDPLGILECGLGGFRANGFNKDLENWILSHSLEDEYKKPHSGGPFKINAQSQYQIIPLPETADYQVKLREKAIEQRQARRETQRDYSKFDLTFNGVKHTNLNKRETMILTMKECVKNGISPTALMEFTGKSRWLWVDKVCQSSTEFETEYRATNQRKYDPSRWFNDDSELLVHNEKTYVFSNQHGKGTGKLVNDIFAKYPELNAKAEKNEG